MTGMEMSSFGMSKQIHFKRTHAHSVSVFLCRLCTFLFSFLHIGIHFALYEDWCASSPPSRMLRLHLSFTIGRTSSRTARADQQRAIAAGLAFEWACLLVSKLFERDRTFSSAAVPRNLESVGRSPGRRISLMKPGIVGILMPGPDFTSQ